MDHVCVVCGHVHDEETEGKWEDLPEDIKNTYDRLGIPDAEKKRLLKMTPATYTGKAAKLAKRI